MSFNDFVVDYQEPAFFEADSNLLRASDDGEGSNQFIDEDE